MEDPRGGTDHRETEGGHWPEQGRASRAYDEIASVTPGVLAQKVIPGPDGNLVYWCGFVGPRGRVGGRLVGRKRRIVPIHCGSATCVEHVDAPEVEDQCERFLTMLGYQGLCGIELKLDPRDGVAKLIEVNPRYSLWDDIGVPVGIDLAHEAVRSLLGELNTEPKLVGAPPSRVRRVGRVGRRGDPAPLGPPASAANVRALEQQVLEDARAFDLGHDVDLLKTHPSSGP